MGILPPKEELIRCLGNDDAILWFYGKGFLGKVQAWIVMSRINVVVKFLRERIEKPNRILDVGCGPMLISYALVGGTESNYVGIDIMSDDRLKKYRDAMRNVGARTVEAVRSSAEALPFRSEAFDCVLSLEVLEHLKKPREAAVEINRVISSDGVVAISLPIENFISRLSRIGLILMKLFGHPILKNVKRIPVTRTIQYHYVGDVKSYANMVKVLSDSLHMTNIKYTPLGLHKAINVYAVHIAQKKLCARALHQTQAHH